jgi:hypothetical protein
MEPGRPDRPGASGRPSLDPIKHTSGLPRCLCAACVRVRQGHPNSTKVPLLAPSDAACQRPCPPVPWRSVSRAASRLSHSPRALLAPSSRARACGVTRRRRRASAWRPRARATASATCSSACSGGRRPALHPSTPPPQHGLLAVACSNPHLRTVRARTHTTRPAPYPRTHACVCAHALTHAPLRARTSRGTPHTPCHTVRPPPPP